MNRYIEKKHVIHTFSPDHVPAASARPGGHDHPQTGVRRRIKLQW